MQATIVYAEDWAGLYIDGTLCLEDHRLHPDDVLRVVGIPCEIRQFDLDPYEDDGFPEKLPQ